MSPEAHIRDDAERRRRVRRSALFFALGFAAIRSFTTVALGVVDPRACLDCVG